MSYKIKIEQFEGPFDLLLFFIERDELDIQDIPIATITNDFLSYIREMESLNIDLASEFIVVAATLMRIKAKMLLPRKVFDEEGNEVDPREELVARLIEYKKYKSVIEDFTNLETLRSQKVVRGYAGKELKSLAQKALVDTELESLTMYKLLKTFDRVMKRFEGNKGKKVHTVFNFNYTVEDQEEYITKLFNQKEQLNFEDIFKSCENRLHAVITFLAILGMLSAQKVSITDRIGINNFYIERKAA